MTTNFQQKKVLFLISMSLAAMTIVAYEPIRHNGFVNYDDPVYITENPIIKSGISWQTPGRVFEPHYFMWHPLTTFSHILDCQLFGLKPFGHHLVNLLLHIINTLLLFWLLSNITGSIWASAFVAAVFALHPLQVESVAWAAERKTVLSGLFWFLTIAVYVWYTRRPSFRRYITLFLAYGLCIMTKPTVITLPLALLLLDYWPLERFSIRGGVNPALPMRRLLIEKVPLLGLSAILGVMTIISQKSGGVVLTLEKLPLDYRIGNMFFSYIRYIGKMIWPSGLAVTYPLLHPNALQPIAVGCAILFVLITVVCIYIGLRRKYVLTGWLWYIGTLVPMIGLVQSGSQAMANRYMYISMLGLLIIIGWVVKDLVDNRPRWKVFAAVLAGVILFSSVVLTRMQVRHWQNSVTLFDYALKVTENNVIAENNYGGVLLDLNRVSEAIPHLNNAVRINPRVYESRYNLGKAYLKAGKLSEAIECFNELIRRKQDSEGVYENLGTAYTQLGKNELAITNWSRAVELKPNNARILNNLAWLLASRDKITAEDSNKAIGYAQHACELTRYKEPVALDTLAVAYAAVGRFADAKATAEKALEAAKAAKQEKLAGEIRERIKLYEAGQRYRQK